MHLKKIAMIYALAGAGTAVYEYSKTKVFNPMTVLLWPVRIMGIVGAPAVK
jgi:hypothetical protein